jgi:hypothetical protein
MADFVSILKKAIDDLDRRPETRETIYQRARAALAARLAVVGPAPAAVVERQKRALEDAIAEVEGSYFDEDPIAELANIFGHSRRPTMVESVAPNTAPDTEAAFRTLVEVDHAPELLSAFVTVTPANDVGTAQHPLVLGSPADPRAPPQPTIAEAADFQVSGEAQAALGNDLDEVPVGGGNTMEFGTHSLNGTTLEASHQLAWDSSSLCRLCQRWALCIDQAQCWHRTKE